MPFLQVDGARIRYEVTGAEKAPTLVFSNSLGTDLAMWDPQVAALNRGYRIVRYDTRGHGQSPETPGPYTIDQLADDVMALLDHLKLDGVYFCGLSMGGMTAMSLALRKPQRLYKIVLCSTAPKIGTSETWNTRIDIVRQGGMAAVVDGVLQRWYTSEFRSSAPQAIESTRQTLLKTSVEGYVACCAAVRDADMRETIAGIRVPTLIIAGTHDPVTTPADGHFMEQRIPGAKYCELPGAHLSNIEAAAAFTNELSNFLKA
jgi:3-oxoadipate enol-lactonase